MRAACGAHRAATHGHRVSLFARLADALARRRVATRHLAARANDVGFHDTRWVKLSDVLAHAADVVGPLLAAFWQPLANAAAADANASGSRGCVSRSV